MFSLTFLKHETVPRQTGIPKAAGYVIIWGLVTDTARNRSGTDGSSCGFSDWIQSILICLNVDQLRALVNIAQPTRLKQDNSNSFSLQMDQRRQSSATPPPPATDPARKLERHSCIIYFSLVHKEIIFFT